MRQFFIRICQIINNIGAVGIYLGVTVLCMQSAMSVAEEVGRSSDRSNTSTKSASSSSATDAAEGIATVTKVLAVNQIGNGEEAPEAPLPEPLSLHAALQLANEPHPDLVQAKANIELAESEHALSASQTNFTATLRARARWIDPVSTALNQDNEDHQLVLLARKPLYDFGKTPAELGAATLEIERSQLQYQDASMARRWQIMSAYFDVLLADLEFSRDNEAMATAYVHWDRQKDRNQQGQISDIELLQAESEYQKQRSSRYASEVRQRTSRAYLAQALNRPGKLSKNLVMPKLLSIEQTLPEFEALRKYALGANPNLLALRKKSAAMQKRMESTRAETKPSIVGELEAGEYARELGSRDPLAAGIVIEFPLTNGGVTDAKLAKQRAEFESAQAQVRKTEWELEQAILSLTQQIHILAAQRDEAKALSNYRDLYLDRSRGLYELDIRTDLGDAMVKFSDARFFTAKTDFALATAWASLHRLLGQDNPLVSSELSIAPGNFKP